MLVFVVATIGNGIIGEWDSTVLPLTPRLIIQDLRLWQLVTWQFVGEPTPISVLLGGLMIVLVGRNLEWMWGARRLVGLLVGSCLTGALLTLALSLVVPQIERSLHYGAWTMVGVMWVATGLSLGRGMTNFWGVQVTGHVHALIGASFPLLHALFGEWTSAIPDGAALLATAAVVYGYTPSRLFASLTAWRHDRDLKKRSSHLKVVGGEERNTPRDSDKYLH